MSGIMMMLVGTGGASRVSSNITISGDVANYVLNTSKVAGYSAGNTDVTLTINSGIFVTSASTGSYAFTVDTSWSSGDTITIVNNGTIIGRGGDGGNGGSGALYAWTSGASGANAGPALLVQRAASINNASGRISGGGGGGGGGGGSFGYDDPYSVSVGGGGGGGGIGVSSGGAGGNAEGGNINLSGNSGGSGKLTSAGGGGTSGDNGSGGGSGGSYGSSGSSGASKSFFWGGEPFTTNGGGGGAAGAAVVGNSNITWIATGTRNGSIS